MGKTLVYFKVGLTAVFTFIAEMLGGWDVILSLLVSLIMVDILTGIINAILNKNVSSSEMRKGIVRKLLIFVVIFVAFQIDRVIIDVSGSPIMLFGAEWNIRTLFIIYACIEEGISLVENLANIGVPFPAWVKGVLEQVSDCTNKSVPKVIIDFVKEKFGIDISGEHKHDLEKK